MLRKAALAVVVVFSHPLDGDYQSILAVAILLLALYFQKECSPFREEFDKLNDLEGYSLLASLLTFIFGQFFYDDRTSSGVRVLISIMLFAVNIGVFSLFAFLLFHYTSDYLQHILDHNGIPHRHDGNHLHVFKVAITHFLLDKIKNTFDHIA